MPNNDGDEEAVTFRTQRIDAWCRNLSIAKRVSAIVDGTQMPTDTPQEQFLASAALLASCFILYANNPTKEPKVVDMVLKLELAP